MAHWLDGTSNGRTSQELKMWKGSVTEIWRKRRSALVRHEQSKAKIAESLCIIDITWGPHRRVAQSGAPSRPRVLDSKPFQVVLAYHMDGEQRRFIPGSLSVQRVVSKKATYNGRVAQTMMEASCRIACDEGGEQGLHSQKSACMSVCLRSLPPSVASPSAASPAATPTA